MPETAPNPHLRAALHIYAETARVPPHIQQDFGTGRWRELVHTRVDQLCDTAVPGEPIIAPGVASRFDTAYRIGGRLTAYARPAVTISGVGLGYRFETPLWNDHHKTAIALKSEVVKTTQPTELCLSPLAYIGHQAIREWFGHQRLSSTLEAIADGEPMVVHGESMDVSRLSLLAETGLDIGDLGWGESQRSAILRNLADAWATAASMPPAAVQALFAVDKNSAPAMLDEILEALEGGARTAAPREGLVIAEKHVAATALKNKRPLRKYDEWDERIMDTRARWLRSA
jgi:hypothetical protein